MSDEDEFDCRPPSPRSPAFPPAATAGVMTTRAAAKAFFIDGTNRAMFRFTLLNHMCDDLEQVKDITRVPDRIRQDVSRSPGGDSRLFLNNCIGCHSGMDPLAGAFAYYDYVYDVDDRPGRPERPARVRRDPRPRVQAFQQRQQLRARLHHDR